MKFSGSNRLVKASALAGLISIALAGCGGGGGDTTASLPTTPTTPTAPTVPATPTAPVTVAAVKFPASSGIAIVGTQKTIPVTVIGSDGKAMTGKTIAWSSSDATKATVDANGSVTPVAAGPVAITATVDGIGASVNLVVSEEPANLSAFKALFPFSAAGTSGLQVGSDVTQAYSDLQLQHLQNSWNFFVSFFPPKAGGYTKMQMYYAWDGSLVEYAKLNFGECSSALADLPGRLLVICTESSTGTVSWIISPNLASDGSVPPDYATGLATVSQSFMDSITAADIYTWPWLWEGLSIAFKSGDFNDGPYTMRDLADPERSAFKQALTAGTLLPLTDPVALDLVELYRNRIPPSTGTWYGQEAIGEPQSAMLMNYLFRNYPSVVQNLFAAVAGGGVTNSADAFAYILDPTTGIGMSAADLDTAYKAWGAAH